ncbi:MAG TPA: lipoate--protein ligase family protein [Verrucomicrobiae bacterium]|nr:lipoate--protein ligase family protein [Verrucomicrobiae bacterium]
MAVDEGLLEAVARWKRPVLRFYRWSEPAATFGYFQKYKEVEPMTALRPLVRRSTGGGLVPHDADWTYSLVFPPSADWYGLKAIDSYRGVHAWIKEAFARLGLASELAPQRSVEQLGQCFVGAEQFDLVWNERKIAGAAQRRTKEGLLIQGSIQPPVGIHRADWENAFLDSAGVQWQPLAIDETFEARVRDLAGKKYSRPEYNQRR